MAVSIAAILGELREIERRSPEDVAVLMTPLLRALEAVADGRDPQLDHAQAMAIANSLAQTAAQAGDVHVAVAIATVSAELEQVPPATFAGTGIAPAPVDTAPAPSAPPPLGPFANPYQQLLGIFGICALSYAGYLAIQAHFQPGSVAGWLLTGSSSLFALAVALAWRRFVLRQRRGRAVTVAALLFAALAAGWTVHTGLTLRPQMAGSREPGSAPAVAGPMPGTAAQATDAAQDTDDEGQGRAPDQTRLPDPAPIAFWWLGGSSEPTSTRIPEAPQRATTGDAPPPQAQARAPAPGTAGTSTDAGADRPEPVTAAAPHPPPTSDRAQATAPTPGVRAQTPLARYRGLLERQVVVTDAKGMHHEGKLTGISKHGVTLLMEVQLFGEPIVAQRFYLFDNIENLRAK